MGSRGIIPCILDVGNRWMWGGWVGHGVNHKHILIYSPSVINFPPHVMFLTSAVETALINDLRINQSYTIWMKRHSSLFLWLERSKFKESVADGGMKKILLLKDFLQTHRLLCKWSLHFHKSQECFRFEVSIVVNVSIEVFWVMTPHKRYQWIEYQCPGESCCLHLQKFSTYIATWCQNLEHNMKRTLLE
jgi:hypothetical protein